MISERAADSEVEALAAEFTGRAPMRPRSPRQLESAYGRVIDSLLGGMGAENVADREQPQRMFERIALRTTRPGAEGERVAVCKASLARLGSSTSQPARIWMLRQLARCGGRESVDTLAGLLDDPDPDIRETSRRALQTNPSRAATTALRRALGRTHEATWQAALINALAVRHDSGSRVVFVKLATDGEPQVSTAAIAALAELGDPPAVAALDALRRDPDARRRERALTGLLRCADRWAHAGRTAQAARLFEHMADMYAPDAVHVAAIRGLVATRREAALPMLTHIMRGDDELFALAAAAMATEIPGDRTTQALADALPAAPPAVQARLLAGLAERGGAAAHRAAGAALQSPEPEVRTAAARALAQLGDASSILPLAELASEATGTQRDAARWALARLRGDNIDAAIIRLLDTSPPGAKAELIRSIGERHNRAALQRVFAAATDAHATVRVAALEVLASMAAPADLPQLVRLLIDERDEQAREAAENTVVAVANRISEPAQRAESLLTALPQTDGSAKAALIRAMGRIGGDRALEAIRAARATEQTEVVDAAVRALTAWPEAVVLDDLLAIAANGADPTHGALALRGYVRLVRLPSKCTPPETLAMLDRALWLCQQDEEKKLVLSALGEVRDLDALARAQSFLANESLRDEAASAVVACARGLAAEHLEQAVSAIQQAQSATSSEQVGKQADEALELIRRHTGYISTWMVAGPYQQEGTKGPELFDVAFAPESSESAGIEWRAWHARRTTNPWLIDLLPLDAEPNRCAYARAVIWSERDQPAQLEIGNDDGVKVWLNDELVYQKNSAGGMGAERAKVPVTLRAQRNTLLLKVAQGMGDWGFCCGVKSSDGADIEGVRFTAE